MTLAIDTLAVVVATVLTHRPVAQLPRPVCLANTLLLRANPVLAARRLARIVPFCAVGADEAGLADADAARGLFCAPSIILAIVIITRARLLRLDGHGGKAVVSGPELVAFAFSTAFAVGTLPIAAAVVGAVGVLTVEATPSLVADTPSSGPFLAVPLPLGRVAGAKTRLEVTLRPTPAFCAAAREVAAGDVLDLQICHWVSFVDDLALWVGFARAVPTAVAARLCRRAAAREVACSLIAGDAGHTRHAEAGARAAHSLRIVAVALAGVVNSHTISLVLAPSAKRLAILVANAAVLLLVKSATVVALAGAVQRARVFQGLLEARVTVALVGLQVAL